MSKKRPPSQRSVGTLEIRDKRKTKAKPERTRRFPSPPPVPPVDSETTEITQQVIESRGSEQETPTDQTKDSSPKQARISPSGERALIDEKLPLAAKTLAGLSPKEDEILKNIFTGIHESRRLEDATKSPRRALQRLIHADGFQHLDAEFQIVFLKLISHSEEPLDLIRHLQKLICTSDLITLTPSNQDKVVKMFRSFTPSKRDALVQISQRRLGNRSVFVDTDFGDTPFVQILDELIHKAGISTTLTRNQFTHGAIIAETLHKLAHPASISRGKGGAGILNTIEFALYSDAPAEILRYWNEITSEEMTIDLPSQRQVKLHKLTHFERNRGIMGTALEALLNVAYPRGALTYESLMMPGGHSIDVDVLARVLCEVYGLEFRIVTSPTKAMKYLSSKPKDHFRIPPIFIAIASNDVEGLFLFDGYEDEFTFIRSPHGGSLKQSKEKRKQPTRTVVCLESGQDKIENSLLRECIRFVLAPKT